VDELLTSVNWPVAAPTAVGSNTMLIAADWFGFRVTGYVAPEAVNPLPLNVAPLMVTATLPVDVRVRDCVVGVFSVTSPNVTLELFTLSIGTAAPSCNAKVLATPPALAVRVTVSEELTDETLAAKLTFVEPDPTITEAGTVTALLLLVTLTAYPLLGAAVFNVTVQLSVPAAVIEPFAQANVLKLAVVVVPAAVPVPLSPTTSLALVVALLVIVNCPFAAPI